MKLNSAVTKVYAFLNKISQNKLFKNQTNQTESITTESDVTQIIPTQINLNQTNQTNLTATTATAPSQPNQPNQPNQPQPAAHKSQQKSKLRRIVEPIAFVLAGLLCFAYPVCSTLWNNRVSKEISAAYDKYNHDQAGDVRRANLRAARLYNKHRKNMLAQDPYGDGNHVNITETPAYKEYLKVLDEPMGVMGIVKIPKIGVKLPIYHGSSQEVLARGAGHLYGTDLPVGGKNRHAVVTAHTGLPNATMFDDLVNLKKGDFFYFDVQGETLRYKVFRISVVDPHDISLLQREKGRDLATLLTCTPYGVNSHRLLVTGYRVLPDPVKPPEDHVQWPLWMTLFVLAMILTIAVLITMVVTALRKRRDELYVRGKHLLLVSRDALRKLRRG